MAHYDLPDNSEPEFAHASGAADPDAPSVETVTTLHTRIMDLAGDASSSDRVPDEVVADLLHAAPTRTRAAVTELLPGLVHIDVHDDEGDLKMRYLAQTPERGAFPAIDDEVGESPESDVRVNPANDLPIRVVEELTLGAIAVEDVRLFGSEEDHDANQLANSLVGAPLSATSLISVDVFEYYANRDPHKASAARAIIHGYCRSVMEHRAADGSAWLKIDCQSACPITVYVPAGPWREHVQPGMIIEGMFMVVVGIS